MLPDNVLRDAISNIQLRAEKQEDPSKILASFVDSGVMAALNNKNSQILYGRRGTGKTHLLRFYEQQLVGVKDCEYLYIDMRTLSSTGSLFRPELDRHHCVVGIAKDILLEIYNLLQNFAAKHGGSTESIKKLEAFGDAITEFTKIPLKEQLIQEKNMSEEEKATAGISSLPNVTMGVEDKIATQNSAKDNLEVILTDSMPFQLIFSTLRDVLKANGIKQFYLLLDEWATLPEEIQPFLAEFLKRTLLPNPSITIKIASIEYRSKFNKEGNSTSKIGFELGSDIFANINLDEYFVFDMNPIRIENLFKNILYKHLLTELPKEYHSEPEVANAEKLMTRIFSSPKTFVELVRASEGVVRDFINIFTVSYFTAIGQGKGKGKGKGKTDINSVQKSAQRWYEQDKSSHMDKRHHKALEKIMQSVIGEKHARTFLVPREDANHPFIRELVDLRLLHKIQTGYSDKENPGKRYNIFTLDYGTYVDLLKTKGGPEVEMRKINKVKDVEERIVPFDDKRSIRRVILDPIIFEKI